MLKIGCHLSSSNGFTHMLEEAKTIGANTFQFFTRNPRGGDAKDIDPIDIKNFLRFKDELGIDKIIAHASYTLNLCSKDQSIRDFALRTFKDDLKRMEYIKGNYYNFHPGSHVGQGEDVGIQFIIDALNDSLSEDQNTIVLLETMAGKGSEIGRNFEELKRIIDGVKLKDKIGVLLDTCHVHEGGYDIVNDLDGVLGTFDKIIGLDRLKAIHLNDSMNPRGAHKDRHAKIGEGHIGNEALIKVINNPHLKNLPFILETPNDLDGYAREIAFLKEHYED